MTVNYEIKSQLAKLLATEDLVVENRDVDTAQFNVGTRVLTLPLWKRASNTVYDLLVGHEVGHALFTPDEDWTEKIKVPQQFVNVCEDARIEKLMKRKYPGLAKTFYNGYNELNDQDFFELDGEDISTFNLADRANLYFKSCSLLPLSFSDTEKKIIDLISKSETFNDTLSAAEALYSFCKQEQEKQQQHREEVGVQQEFGMGNQDSGMDMSGNDSSPSDSDSGDNADTDVEVPNSISNGVPSNPSPLEVQTDSILNEKLSELNETESRRNAVDNIYCEVPDVDVDKIIINNQRVHNELDEFYNLDLSADYDGVDEDYFSFKKSAKKEVSYLVKEFECRKAADNYARSSTSRTGVLDTKKLHQYKFSEDIFRRIGVVPDGKNHGLIFILDWSGSMTSCLKSTIKQLYNLIWFCQKVQIPFEVYALSNAYYYYDPDVIPPNYVEAKENEFHVENRFCLLNFFSSKVNKAKLENHLINIWRLASALDYGSRFSHRLTCPNAYSLGGTPLNETIVSLHKIIPQFKTQNKIQKVQCVILTDGEAGQLPVYRSYKDIYHDNELKMGTRHWNPETSYLRNRKTGYTYKLPYQYHQFTEVLLKDLKTMNPDVNFIGIRVTSSRDFNSFIRRYGMISDEDLKKARKNKSYSIKDCGYDTYFAIMDTSLSNDDEFDVQEDASKAQIKRAFVKSLQAKKLNKKVLGEFVELVA